MVGSSCDKTGNITNVSSGARAGTRESVELRQFFCCVPALARSNSLLSVEVMAQRILLVLCVLCFASCRSEPVSVESPLTKVKLVQGMSRSEVENLVATALSKKSDYSPYGNNLEGGVVKYTDSSMVLEVTFERGAPAPRFLNGNGDSEDRPPIDETVKSFRLFRTD